MRSIGKLSSLLVFSAIAALISPNFCIETKAQTSKAPPAVSEEEMQTLRKKAQESPEDAKACYAYAECLRKTGQLKEAAKEYLAATVAEPSMYIAYHQLCICNPQPSQLDEAITRLSSLKDEQPTVLMLRVALSECLEQRGSYYEAARTLIDLVYQNAIPPKYVTKVNARVHYLLSKTRDAEAVEKIHAEDGEADTALPLPDSSLRNLKASQTNEPQNFGHAQVLH